MSHYFTVPALNLIYVHFLCSQGIEVTPAQMSRLHEFGETVDRQLDALPGAERASSLAAINQTIEQLRIEMRGFINLEF